MTCECGCGWEGEDEVTQWLVEEALHLKLVANARKRDPEEEAAELLMSRHTELLALKASMGAG